jgi:hypothetical protein
MPVTYQSIINEINEIPVAFLQDVYDMVHNYHVQIDKKEQNRNKILQFAGDWADLSDNDFLEITGEIKRSRDEMFSHEVELRRKQF